MPTITLKLKEDGTVVKANALLQEIAEQVPKMVRSFDSQDWMAFREALERIYAVAESDEPLDHVWDLLFGDCFVGGLIIDDDDDMDSVWTVHRIFLETMGVWEAFLAEDEEPPVPKANSGGQLLLPFSPCEPKEPEEDLGPRDTPPLA